MQIVKPSHGSELIVTSHSEVPDSLHRTVPSHDIGVAQSRHFDVRVRNRRGRHIACNVRAGLGFEPDPEARALAQQLLGMFR
jgi:hypothetical protein